MDKFQQTWHETAFIGTCYDEGLERCKAAYLRDPDTTKAAGDLACTFAQESDSVKAAVGALAMLGIYAVLESCRELLRNRGETDGP